MRRLRRGTRAILFGLAVIVVLLFGAPLPASAVLLIFDGGGLSGTAEFTLLDSNTIQVVLTNTSTAVSAGFDSSDQLLTTIAFDLPGDIHIISGSAAITSGSSALNFDVAPVAGDVSSEWGYGQSAPGNCCEPFPSLLDWASTMEPGTTQFAAGNLDGIDVLDGPQGGLTNGLVPLGDGLGAIQNSVTLTLNLSGNLANLDFLLLSDSAVIEFGSDRAFVSVPEPSSLVLMVSGLLGLGLLGRRRLLKGIKSHDSI